jgi:hypothetical protein
VADVFSGIHGYSCYRFLNNGAESNRSKEKDKIIAHLREIAPDVQQIEGLGGIRTTKEANPNFWFFK